MGEVVADVAENSSTENGRCGEPVPIEYCVRKLVERRCKRNE